MDRNIGDDTFFFRFTLSTSIEPDMCTLCTSKAVTVQHRGTQVTITASATAFWSRGLTRRGDGTNKAVLSADSHSPKLYSAESSDCEVSQLLFSRLARTIYY